MKTTWELSEETISDILKENKRTFNYVKNDLARFFLQVTPNGIDLYFKDTAGILKYHKDVMFINKPTKNNLFAVDFQKLTNALLRFQSGGAHLTLNDSTLMLVGIDNNTTVVKLSATPSKDDLDTFLKEKEDNKNKLVEYEHSDQMNKTFELTSKLMNNGNPNNCLAILNGNVAMYADRSVIYKEKCKTSFTDKVVSIHSFLIGFITNTFQLEDAKFYFDFDNSALYFTSKEVAAYLLSETPTINLPTEDELLQIRPTEEGLASNTLVMEAAELANSLDFFEGFFERDVWKPITFHLNQKEQKLTYESPVTSVDKPIEGDVETTLNIETVFTLASSPLLSLLNNSLHEGYSTKIVMLETPKMPGVSITSKDENFELILAKLNF